jgi:acyl carrier protein
MDKQDFIARFTEQLEGHDGTPIKMDTVFRTIDVWDSLTGVAVQIMISDVYNSAIPDAEFRASITVEDLYLLAIKHQK